MQEIRELVDLLNHYCDAYYNQNTSLISDKEYDELFDKLRNLENTLGIVYADSPTQRVGYYAVSNLKKLCTIILFCRLIRQQISRNFIKGLTINRLSLWINLTD